MSDSGILDLMEKHRPMRCPNEEKWNAKKPPPTPEQVAEQRLLEAKYNRKLSSTEEANRTIAVKVSQVMLNPPRGFGRSDKVRQSLVEQAKALLEGEAKEGEVDFSYSANSILESAKRRSTLIVVDKHSVLYKNMQDPDFDLHVYNKANPTQGREPRIIAPSARIIEPRCYNLKTRVWCTLDIKRELADQQARIEKTT